MSKPPVKPRPAFKRKILPTIEVDISRLDDDGVAVGRYEGKDIQIAGALPGEKVLVTIAAEGQYRYVGRLRKVINRHRDRIQPACSCAGSCQGCSLIALDYPAQLQFKETKVRAALARFAPLKETRLQPIWAAEQPFGYRTNAKLVMGRVKGQVRIGLYRRGTHEVVDIADCPLHHPLINRIAQVVKEEVARQEIFVYDPIKKRGLLRFLSIRVSPDLGKAMVTFITAERDFRQTTHLAKWLTKKLPEIISVQQNVNPTAGNVVFGRDTMKMLGVPDLLDQVGEVRLRIAPTSFFQVNNAQAARIYALVREWAALRPEETAVDLYCGIGGIALNLARDAGRVVGIEVVEEAVRNARENARLNGRHNCSFIAGDAVELVHELVHEVAPGAVITVNPPRSGCDAEVLETLAALAPRLLIYVSCNPDTLARDLDILAGLGYATEEVQPVDMFPQTPHVESVARLVPRQVETPVKQPREQRPQEKTEPRRPLAKRGQKPL